MKKYNSINEAEVIAPKDWDRMLDLVMKGDDGEKAAKLIKNKSKAIARFVTGLKLSNRPLDYNVTLQGYSGMFSDLGDKALEMGATREEIENLYNNTQVPQKYLDKMASMSGKKLKNRFVSDISKAVLDAGYDIIYEPHNGSAITHPGMSAMSRNGRKWTIGYKTIIKAKGKDFTFWFDAITDEGDGPTSYVVHSMSDSIFNNLMHSRMGKQK